MRAINSGRESNTLELDINICENLPLFDITTYNLTRQYELSKDKTMEIKFNESNTDFMTNYSSSACLIDSFEIVESLTINEETGRVSEYSVNSNS